LQELGTLIEGKYEIIAKIREGGMGTIYKVRHRLLDEVRVVKVMQPHVVADADLKRRFLEEAKTAIRLKHPNICTIHDYAVDEMGVAYLVMEFIDGVSLADLLKSPGRPGVPLTLEIAHQVLLALGYLHRKGVVHRDVAPDNLMLTQDEDGSPFVKLIDLGIAKAANRPMEMTATGVFLGKLRYASPEQYGMLAPGERLDGRSDLYGLGVVLYELLTGTRPFVGESPAEHLRAHLLTPPTPFSESDPAGRVPADLRAVILKALAKKREDRYATAEEFDREIVALRQRYVRPDDLDQTAAIVSSLRKRAPRAADDVTPSAQDRLDRHFGAQATPLPTKPSSRNLPDLPVPDDKTAINPRLAAQKAPVPLEPREAPAGARIPPPLESTEARRERPTVPSHPLETEKIELPEAAPGRLSTQETSLADSDRPTVPHFPTMPLASSAAAAGLPEVEAPPSGAMPGESTGIEPPSREREPSGRQAGRFTEPDFPTQPMPVFSPGAALPEGKKSAGNERAEGALRKIEPPPPEPPPPGSEGEASAELDFPTRQLAVFFPPSEHAPEEKPARGGMGIPGESAAEPAADATTRLEAQAQEPESQLERPSLGLATQRPSPAPPAETRIPAGSDRTGHRAFRDADRAPEAITPMEPPAVPTAEPPAIPLPPQTPPTSGLEAEKEAPPPRAEVSDPESPGPASRKPPGPALLELEEKRTAPPAGPAPLVPGMRVPGKPTPFFKKSKAGKAAKPRPAAPRDRESQKARERPGEQSVEPAGPLSQPADARMTTAGIGAGARHPELLPAIPLRDSGRQAPADLEFEAAASLPVVEPSAPPSEPWTRRRFALWLALALGVITAVLLLSRRRPVEKVVTPPRPTAVAKATATPLPSPVPTTRPTTRPTAVPSPRPTTRPFAEQAREAALGARQSSDRSRGPELAPGTYQRAVAKQIEGEKLAARGNDTAAKAAFDAAAGLFAQSEADAKKALLHPTRVSIPTRTQPTRPPLVEPTPVTVATLSTGAGASEQEKIRETVRLYQKAWSTLDANLFARVFPSGVANFEQGLKNLRSQSVEIQIRRIDLTGARNATVEGYEKIVAQPRAGVEQRAGGDVVLRLEKRGDAWIIVGRS
jgi:eukaryotic-like serine/threonine-protein kinase